MFKKLYTEFRLTLCFDGIQRANYLKRHKIFYDIGDHCYWHPRTIPSEPYLLKMHNNVVIAADCTFYTHDILEYMFNYISNKKYQQFLGPIEIFDNCFIGARSSILYNVKIGPNAIVAAGSVVTKDVPEGSIVAGNPARIVGSFDDLMHKRLSVQLPDKAQGVDEIEHFFWGRGGW